MHDRHAPTDRRGGARPRRATRRSPARSSARAYLAAIDERDPELHCYLHRCEEPERDGIPIALKDVISTKGIETTAGSKILESYVPVFDATVAARCKAQRACACSARRTPTSSRWARRPRTPPTARRATRGIPTRVPGGSGGGSAAAVSAGLAPWALGSDTGGSIKQPSALCGNVGLRPTYGTVSRYGVVAFASSLDQVGPVAKNVRDCALLYSIIAGRDPRDSTTVDVPEVELPTAETWRACGSACPREMNEAEGIEPGVARGRRSGDRAGARARRRGGGVLAAALGRVRAAVLLPRRAGRGVRRTSRATTASATASARTAPTSARWSMRTRDDGFGDEPKRRIMLGTYALSAGYYDAYYGKAQQVRTRDRARARARPSSASTCIVIADLADGRLPARREGGRPARDVPLRPADDPVLHGRPARV